MHRPLNYLKLIAKAVQMRVNYGDSERVSNLTFPDAYKGRERGLKYHSINYGVIIRITLRILNSLNLIAKDYSLCTPIIYACTVIYLLSVRVYTAILI